LPTSSRSTDPRPREVAAVVFDLDGTLVDSSPDLATAVNRLRAELGLSAVPLPTVVSWIGEGARRLVEKALAGTEHHVGRALDRFLSLYDSICTDATRPYAGVDAVLAELRVVVPLALLTNKPERMTRRVVERFAWTGYFEPLIGGDTLPFRKPDPRGLVAIAERLEVPVATLLLVGDSAIDLATARSAGASFVWAAWGFAQPGDLAELAAAPAARSPVDLPAMVRART
jgi:phosphoglycolate phosphatase